jgi:single-stranded DNA-specific DHH superfamily exonuclease
LEKEIFVDTFLTADEWTHELLSQIDQLAPFGEGNPEPRFLLSSVLINKIEKI